MAGRFPFASSRADLPAGEPHVPILFPFWGRAEEPGRPRQDYADELVVRGREFLELTRLEEAQALVFPLDWKRALPVPERRELGRRAAARAADAGKPAAFFWASDDSSPFEIEGSIVFRPSLYASRRQPNEFALPGLHEDLLEYCGGTLRVRRKAPRATVGFCGYAPRLHPPPTLPARIRRAAGDLHRAAAVRRGLPLPEDVYVRAEALDALAEQSHVETNIVLRDDYGGGAVFPKLDLELWRRRRLEFVENALASDYILCTRGNGNYSYRLYETLCLGRIPVFVDTDCVLPYDFALDWPSFGVWLDRRDRRSVGERVAEFHAALSDEQFVELQRRCRALWVDYLSPLGYFSKLHLHFDGARCPASGGCGRG